MMDIENMVQQAKTLKIRKQLYLDDLKSTKTKVLLCRTEQDDCLQARAIVQKVAEETQKKIEFQISNLVSLALASVFPDPYKFDLRFVQRRNRTECDLIFSKNGNETDDILFSGGGGVADVASFALRIALWSLKKSRATFILDETWKFLHSPVYQEKVSIMLKELSEKLGIQIIMISDQLNILNAVDKVFRVENSNGNSKIIET